MKILADRHSSPTDRQMDKRGSAGPLYACSWLRLHSCKSLIQTLEYSTVQYSTVQYGTEGLPGPALLLPGMDARREKERKRVLQASYWNYIKVSTVKILVSIYCKQWVIWRERERKKLYMSSYLQVKLLLI